MRKFLLVVGVVLILIGLVLTVQILWAMTPSYPVAAPGSRLIAPVHMTPGSSANTGDALLCLVLYGVGFAAIYLRWRITQTT